MWKGRVRSKIKRKKRVGLEDNRKKRGTKRQGD